jgi:hypothetical protein
MDDIGTINDVKLGWEIEAEYPHELGKVVKYKGGPTVLKMRPIHGRPGKETQRRKEIPTESPTRNLKYLLGKAKHTYDPRPSDADREREAISEPLMLFSSGQTIDDEQERILNLTIDKMVEGQISRRQAEHALRDRTGLELNDFVPDNNKMGEGEMELREREIYLNNQYKMFEKHGANLPPEEQARFKDKLSLEREKLIKDYNLFHGQE